MTRVRNVSSRSRTTPPTTGAMPATAGAANSNTKKPKGKAASRQASQPPQQASPRRKRLTTKAAAAATTVATGSSPVDLTRAATPTISSPPATEAPSLPAANEPVASTSSPGPTRTLRPRTPRAQPYTKPSPKARRKPARASTPAPFLEADDGTSDDDSIGPVTPISTPTRPAFAHGTPRRAARKAIGKSPLSKCVMTADDVDVAHSPPPQGSHITNLTPARVSNRDTLLAASLLLSATWGVRFSGVDDDQLAAATTLVHWRELRQAACAAVAPRGRPSPV